jgi:hypothetical protein
VGTTIDRFVVFDAMADDPASTVRAHRRQRVDGALEGIERMGLAVERYRKRLVIIVFAHLALCHVTISREYELIRFLNLEVLADSGRTAHSVLSQHVSQLSCRGEPDTVAGVSNTSGTGNAFRKADTYERSDVMPIVQGGPPEWTWERPAEKLKWELRASQSLDGQANYELRVHCGLEILRLQFFTGEEIKALQDALRELRLRK